MIDQIILSTNENPLYMDFWKPVSWAYKKMFPDVTIHLSFLTNRDENDPLVKDFREYGKVTIFKPLDYITEFAQAKMIRFILASEQGNDVCYIDDIDLFPLIKSFITEKTNKRPKDHMLVVGGECYNNNGQYPISQMTGEGYLWKKLINPNGLSHKDLFDFWLTRDYLYDSMEKLETPMDLKNNICFSDEKLLKCFLPNIKKLELHRGYDNVFENTIDRYDWKIDLEKLNNHEYFNAHGIRPYGKYKEYYLPLIEYINKNY